MVNGAIVYLAAKGTHAELRLSLASLRANFLEVFEYPVVIYHDGFTVAEQKHISHRMKSVTFAPLPACQSRSSFIAHGLFQDSALRPYEWCWRLGSDSLLLSKLEYDPFEYLRKYQFAYGYRRLASERPEHRRGLEDSVKRYARAHDRPLPAPSRLFTGAEWNGTIYGHDFEILRLDFWRSPEYADFLREIGAERSVMEQGWTGAAIRTLALNLFFAPARLHQFEDFTYHQDCTFQARGPLKVPLTPDITMTAMDEHLATHVVPESEHRFYDASALSSLSARGHYNASVFRYEKRDYLLFRTGACLNGKTYLCDLPGDRPENPRPILMGPNWRGADGVVEDARFFTHRGQPWLSHTFFARRPGDDGGSHFMAYTRLNSRLEPEHSFVFPDQPNKNWTFFDQGGRLFAVHGLARDEHRVLEIDEDRVVNTYVTRFRHEYPAKFGHLRGGTNPVLHEGRYWSFFHSSRIKGAQRHYTGGVYAFSAKPPFAVELFSPAPLLLPVPWSERDGRAQLRGRDLLVVFPVGLVDERDGLTVSYGVNDARMAYRRFSWAELHAHVKRCSP